MNDPNRIIAISQHGIGKVPPKARRMLKRMRVRLLRRYVRIDQDNARPKARQRGWYW